MTDPKQLISKYPLAAEACALDTTISSAEFASRVRYVSRGSHIGNSAFDSIESLMQAIESRLASRPKPLTEEDVKEMKWPCDKETDAATKSNTALHNIQIDRLWSAVLAERAEIRRLQAELEAMR